MTEIPDEIPEASEQLDQLQPEDTLLDRGTDDVLDEGYSPPEHYMQRQNNCYFVPI